MRRLGWLALLAALALAAAPWRAAQAALDYTRFAHPRGDYALEYPSDWVKSVGMETLKLHPPGEAGKLARVSVEKHPLGRDDARTPSAFVAGLLKDSQGIERLDSRDTVKVSGRDAQRLTLTETVRLHGKYGTTLPGPMTEVVIVVPSGKGFYVLRLAGTGSALASARPEFDRLVAGFKLGK